MTIRLRNSLGLIPCTLFAAMAMLSSCTTVNERKALFGAASEFGETHCGRIGFLEAPSLSEATEEQRAAYIQVAMNSAVADTLVVDSACGTEGIVTLSTPSGERVVLFAGSRDEATTLGTVKCSPKFTSVYQPPVTLGGSGRVMNLPNGEVCTIVGLI